MTKNSRDTGPHLGKDLSADLRQNTPPKQGRDPTPAPHQQPDQQPDPQPEPWRPGVARHLEPGVSVVLAPNPSPMTFWGTNSFLIGDSELMVIDPGPDSPEHLEALERAIDDRPVAAILVTHAHLDHSPLAPALARLCAAPVLGFGKATAGMAPEMRALGKTGLAGGGEGVDHSFCPDRCLEDGATLALGTARIKALHTPGHMSNHLCFSFDSGDGQDPVLFSGDHLMGWSSSLVSPPDGDLTAFMASCVRLSEQKFRICYPAHGAPVADPAARLRWLIKHREARENQIRAALNSGAATVETLTRQIYRDVDPQLLPAAARNVLAHLIDLKRRGYVGFDVPICATTLFHPTAK